MGNRSKFVAATTTAGVFGLTVWRSRRRRRAHQGADEAHAPGHQHLPPPAEEPPAVELRERPWTRHGHGLRHPIRG